MQSSSRDSYIYRNRNTAVNNFIAQDNLVNDKPMVIEETEGKI